MAKWGSNSKVYLKRKNVYWYIAAIKYICGMIDEASEMRSIVKCEQESNTKLTLSLTNIMWVTLVKYPYFRSQANDW